MTRPGDAPVRGDAAAEAEPAVRTDRTAGFVVTLTGTAGMDGAPLRFEVPPGQTVLQAALAAGIDWSRSCRAGSCRACFCWVRRGGVAHRVDWPSLSPEEREAGAALACVAEPRSDLTLQPDPWGRGDA